MSNADERLENACRKHGITETEHSVLFVFEEQGSVQRELAHAQAVCGGINFEQRTPAKVDHALDRLLSDGYLIQVTKDLQDAVLADCDHAVGPLYRIGDAGNLTATELGMQTFWAVAGVVGQAMPDGEYASLAPPAHTVGGHALI